MNRKRLSILALIMCLVIVFTATVLVACNKAQDDTTADALEPTDGLLISNSDFKVIGTDGDWPRTINDWTGGKLYSSSSIPGSVIAGAVSLDQAIYEANRRMWDDDGSADEDGKTLYDRLKSMYDDKADSNNALMIYMPSDREDTEDEEYGPTAYGYSSKSFSLDKASYYKLSVDVLTYGIAGEEDNENSKPGARIYVSSNTYAEISGIDTNGEWKHYEIYIESAANASSTLTLNLGLGKYSSTYKDGLTTGYAFFDNVTLEKLADKENGATAEEQFKAAQADELQQYKDVVAAGGDTDSGIDVRTASLKVPNGRFDFGSTSISSSSAPSNWTLVTGNASASDPAPTADRFNGIIDVNKFAENHEKYAGTYYIDGSPYTPATKLGDIADDIKSLGGNTFGSNVYMLSQQMMTAQGIKSSRQLVIEKNKLYKISINVYTYNIFGAGVSLVLSGSGEDIVIEGISENKIDDIVLFGDRTDAATTGGWQTYSFYIKGNQFRDMSYNMTLWLGTEGTDSNTKETYTRYSSATSSGTKSTTYRANGTFSSGWVFFDDLALTEYADDAAFNKDKAGAEGAEDGNKFTMNATSSNKTALYVDLTTENMFDNNGIGGFGNGNLGGFNPNNDTSDTATPDFSDVKVQSVDLSDADNAFYKDNGLTAPETPYDIENGYGLAIYSPSNSSYALRTTEFAVEANHFYRISMWVKTDAIKETSGIYAYLMQQDGDENDDFDDKVLASFSAVNTKDADDYTNDWVELSFVIRGDMQDTENVYLRISLGSGSKWASSTLAKGVGYVANMSMTEITYTDFDGTSDSTYVKTVDFSETKSNSFTNGAFDNVDFEETEDAVAAASSSRSMGALSDATVPGVPENWQLSGVQNSEKDNFVGGIVTMVQNDGKWTASNQIKNIFDTDTADSFFGEGFYDYDNPAEIGAPNMLVVSGKNDTAYSAGYLSDRFTLSASTNYTISVWAKAQAGSEGMIFLKGEASGTAIGSDINYFVVNGDDLWHKYTFNIQVGLSSVSLQLGLWLGENPDVTGKEYEEDNYKSSGIIVFDSVTKNADLTDEEFDEIEITDENGAYNRKITFYTDGFDPMSDSVADRGELSSPNGWTGTAGTDQDRDNTKYGILYIDSEYQYVELDENGYLTILGPELELNDFTAEASEIDEYIKENGGDPENEADVEKATEAIKQKKLDEARKSQLINFGVIPPVSDGNRVLVVNNTSDSAFHYASSSYTLKAEQAYKISVKVFTYNIGHIENGVWTAADDKGAYVELYLGSSNESDNPLRFENISTVNGWTTYTFYVLAPDEDVTSVSMRLGLGLYDADDESKLLSGYAMFDDVTIEKIDTDEFDAAAENEFTKVREIPDEPSDGDTGDGDNDVVTPGNKFNLDNLWWMIPTILLGLAIIAVVIVFFVKKYKKKLAKGSSEVITDSESQSNINKKKDDYDSFNE